MQYEADEAFVGGGGREGQGGEVREERRVEYVLVRLLGVCLTVGLVGVRLWLESFPLISIDERLLTAE